MYDHPVYTTDFSCPIHKLAKDLMLRVRHYESGSRPISLDMLKEDSEKLKQMILELDYETLGGRKDLLFYLRNANARIKFVKDQILKNNFSISLDVVEGAVKGGYKKW